ncbi:MAG: SUMF1/EgtB/PvdO family nonheme iron enzyme [Verrucomicrobiota bacterium]
MPHLVRVPGGAFRMGSREGDAEAQPHEAAVNDFWMGRCEVTVGEYAEYLNSATPATAPATGQLAFRAGRYVPRWGTRDKPVTHVSYDDAAAYCRWLGRRDNRAVRLPAESEWEYAARGGIARARYPWGWGDPAGRACCCGRGPRRVGSFEPNPFGLYDMAGNVFEWCAADAGSCTSGEAVARGGSWAERDTRFLRVFHRARFRRDYRDADVGFRILVES